LGAVGRDEEPLITVRPAQPADFAAIERFDLTYSTGRYLALDRSGDPPEHTFSLSWETRAGSPPAVYAAPTVTGLTSAHERANLFLVAEVDSVVAGYLIVLVPNWAAQVPNAAAAEITDLAVDQPARRVGFGRALVEAAANWARGGSFRAVWVEPRADNAAAIAFYLSLKFRISGFNDRVYANDDDEPGKPTIYMHLELS